MTTTPKVRHYVAIFFLSLSILMLEISFARILSITLRSHFAFVAVSMTMFGIGFSGLIVYLFPKRFPADALDRQIIVFSALFAMTTVICMFAYTRIRVIQEVSIQGFLSLTAVYALLSVPFFFGGLCISLLLTHLKASIGRIYAADLLGAGLGCICVVIIMEQLPTPWIPFCVSVFVTLLSAWMAFIVSPKFLVWPGAAALVLGMVLLVGERDAFRLRYIKSWLGPYAELEIWNSFSRVSAFRTMNPDGKRRRTGPQTLPMPYGNDAYYDEAFPLSMMLDIDGTAWTPMIEFDGDRSRIQFLRESVLYTAHHLRPDAEVLIIGTGGGRDILAALAFNQPRILGIELNPLMERIVNDRYADFSGRPYYERGVDVIIDEARSRLESMDDQFDIIQLSLIDTYSLNAAGGMVYTENGLYTHEAYRSYYEHLAPGGILSVSRYFTPDYPFETIKLMLLARSAWEAEGVEDVSRNIIVLKRRSDATLLTKKSPFSRDEIDSIYELVERYRMNVLYIPHSEENNRDLEAAITAPDMNQYIRNHAYDIAPPTDDRPFFFNILRHREAEVLTQRQDPFQFMKQGNEALGLMYALIAIVSVLAAAFFILPLAFFARRASTQANFAPTLLFLFYFSCLGYGFMMIELPLLQRLVLFLGYPVYALAVVLSSLLVFSGIGSFISSKITLSPAKALPRVLIVIVGIGLIYLMGMSPVLSLFRASPIAVRIVFCTVLLAPIGLVLGMAFPLGISALDRISSGMIPWAWGLNAGFSVVASVLAPFLGSRIGFSAALLTGILAYATGWVAVMLARRMTRG